MRVGVYPGSFDPVTNGHLDIISRARHIVDKLIVAVVENPQKNPLFSLEERQLLLEESCCNLENIEVTRFSGLLVDFLKEQQATIIVKGLRAVSDFEYEFQMALLNRSLDRKIDTIFLMTEAEQAFLSSSSVREISRLGGDVSKMVPPCVHEALRVKYDE